MNRNRNFHNGGRGGDRSSYQNRPQTQESASRSAFETKIFTGNGEGLTQEGQELVRKLIVDGDSLVMDQLASGLANILRSRQLPNAQFGKVRSEAQKLHNKLSLRALTLFKSTLAVIGARQKQSGGLHLATLLSAMVDQMIADNNEETAQSRFKDNFSDFFKALTNYATAK